VREILAGLGPALELIGWVALLGALGFLIASRAAARHHRAWLPAACRAVELEGQRCLVFEDSGGTAHSVLLEDGALNPDPGSAPTELYYRPGREHEPRLDRPESHHGTLALAGWVLLGLFALCNVLPLAAQAVTTGARA